MELNREQIITALECCTKGTCCSCPRFKKVPCQIPLMRDALSLIKELTEEQKGSENLIYEMSKIENRMSETIEELTSEKKLLNVELEYANSEILRLIVEKKELTRKLKCAELQIEAQERICESYMLQYGTVADKEVWLKKQREATIQKYREALYRAFAHFDSNDKFNKKVFLEVVDQIAKEMIEGEIK